MSEFEERVLRDLSELKAHMGFLVGSGNEGKIQEIEVRVAKHEAYIQRLGGLGAAFGVLLTLIHVAFDYMKTVRVHP